MTDMPPQRPKIPFQARIASAFVQAASNAARRRDGTVNRLILSAVDFRCPPNPTPVDGVSTSDHAVDPARNLKVRLFSPSPPSEGGAGEETSLPVVVFIHGGGFVMNSATSRPFDALCRRLARRIPAAVVSVDYRLAPEHRLPAPYDDGEAVLRWLDSSPAALPLTADLSSVFIAGDSAGGNIAHHVARRATTSPSSFTKLSIAGLIAIQPFFGSNDETDSEKNLDGQVPFGSRERHKYMWRSFLPPGAALGHEAANVFGPGSASASEGWTGFPSTMVAVGGLDMLQDRDRWYGEGLRGAGVDVTVVEYPDGFHGFYIFSGVPAAGKFVDDVAEFVQRQLQRRRGGEK